MAPKESFLCIFRAGVILTPLAVGIYLLLVGIFGHSHNVWAGLGYLVASSAVTYALFRWLVWDDFDFENGSPIAAIAGVLGIIGVLTASNIFKNGYFEVRSELQSAFLDASLSCSENYELFNKGLKSCSLAPYSDAINLTNELAKAKYLTSTLSLADGVYHSTDDAKADACLVNYYLLSKKCPASFSSFNKKHPEMTPP